MFSKILGINSLKFMTLILLILCLHQEIKKTDVELELLRDNDMLLMVEEGIRSGMCQAVYRYVKANNKYMKNYNKKIESS